MLLICVSSESTGEKTLVLVQFLFRTWPYNRSNFTGGGDKERMKIEPAFMWCAEQMIFQLSRELNRCVLIE